MHESFLHYLWQMQYFDKSNLLTTAGESVQIFNQGNANTNAGPDFSNARVRIGPIDWIGSVEVHVNSSMWFEHHHEVDSAYDNVILHLVWKHDKDVIRTDGTILPTLEVRDRVEESLLRRYRQLAGSAFSIPCKRSLPEVNEVVRLSMLDKALLQRLQRKASDVMHLYQQNENDWEETWYQLLARDFGFKINADPFFRLAKLLPNKILRRHADKPEQIEALLFGQSGFLDRTKGDSYYLMLRREHKMLAHKYGIVENKMSRSQWKFLRLRPANFPSLRIAQFAALIYSSNCSFSKITSARILADLKSVLTVMPSAYWRDHYQFGKKSTAACHEIGESSVESIIINSVAPLLVAYGRHHDRQDFIDRAMQILQQVPPEGNRITRTWQDIGLVAGSAFDSQALIELYNNFCQQNNCLNCNIGAALIRPAR